MSLSILVALLAAPALLGTQESIRQSQAKERKEEHRARRCNLIATCVKSSMRSRELNGRPLVLRNGKLYIDTGTSDGVPYGHQYAGYYLPYPDVEYEGMVTTITDEAPVMNWVYVDKDTYEVKYGVRANAQPNITGPFDCTRQDKRLTLFGWEGWCAVEEFPNLWAVYFDKDDNGLQSKISPGTRVLEIELSRKEKRFKMDTTQRQEDQATQRAVDVKVDAPVDTPITINPPPQHPGVNSTPLGPFKMPTSDFLQKQQPEAPIPPKSPPPAYTPNVEPSFQPSVTSPRRSEVTPPPPSLQTSSIPSPSLQASSKSSPSSPPTNFSNVQSTPHSDGPTPPKLRRKTGTRTLEQAKVFERLSQSFTRNIPIRESSKGQGSNREAISQNYSRRPGSSSLSPKTASSSPKRASFSQRKATSSPTKVVPSLVPQKRRPQPLFKTSKVSQVSQVSPGSDPAVFGPISTKPVQQDRSDFVNSVEDKKQIEHERSVRRPSDSGAQKTSLPPLPASSSSSRRPMLARDGPEPLSPSLDRRRKVSTENSSFEKRRPRTAVPNENARSTPTSVNSRSTPAPLRRRGDSISSQNTPAPARRRGDSNSSQKDDTSKSNPRYLPRAASTRNLAQNFANTTIPTSRNNQGASSRIGSQPAPVRSDRSQTTSSLFRELDDILQLDTSEVATTVTASSSQISSTRDRRPPPLKREILKPASRRKILGGSPIRRDAPDMISGDSSSGEKGAFSSK